MNVSRRSMNPRSNLFHRLIQVLLLVAAFVGTTMAAPTFVEP